MGYSILWLEEVGHGLWASRPIAVLKKGPDGKLAEDFDVRPCGAYIEVNDETEQEPVDSGSPPEELRQTLGDSITFFGTDVHNAHRQIELHEDSKPLTTLFVDPTRNYPV
jgi:hypothetical protein